MAKYLRLTRVYLVVLTLFVFLRLVLEAAGASESLTSELSITRLYVILPLFLALQFVSRGYHTLKELLLANLTYFGWAQILLLMVRTVNSVFGLQTHYGGVDLVVLHTLALNAVIYTLLGSLLCWVAIQINRRLLWSGDFR